LNYCLETNAKLAEIDKYHIIVDVDDPTSFHYLAKISPKIQLHVLPQRPTFLDYFQLINKTSSQPHCINILSNTDIVFTPSLSLLKSAPFDRHVFVYPGMIITRQTVKILGFGKEKSTFLSIVIFL
jgi:hypothetical protein